MGFGTVSSFLLQMIRLNGVVEAVCEHLTSLITNPKHKGFTRCNKRNIQVDPSKLPTSLVDHYVIYDYKTQLETLSADEKKPFHYAYFQIRAVYLLFEMFKTGYSQ